MTIEGNFFVRRLLQLSGRLGALESELSRMNVRDAERELDACSSLLEMMYDYSSLHSIDLGAYFTELRSIEQQARTVKLRLENARRRQGHHDETFWGRVVGFAGRVLNFVSTVMGFGPIVPRLGAHQDRRLIGSGRDPDE